MRIKCPTCSSITEIEPPVLLAVCLCGALVRGRVEGGTATGAHTTQAASVDHYVVLGVEKGVSDAEIKAAYRRRAKETHPDVGGDPEEFKLVQSAYEVLGNAERRHQYDAGVSFEAKQTLGVIVPDFVGKSVNEAVRIASENGLVARVAIIETRNDSPLRGRVVGQLPYPGTETVAGIVGFVVAVAQASTLWQRFKAAASELAMGFWVGLKNSTAGNSSQPREIGSGSGLHNAGAMAGEVVGAVAVGAVGVAIGAVTFAARAVMVFSFIVMIVLTFVLLALVPPLGVAFGCLTGWLIYKAANKNKQNS